MQFNMDYARSFDFYKYLQKAIDESYEFKLIEETFKETFRETFRKSFNQNTDQNIEQNTDQPEFKEYVLINKFNISIRTINEFDYICLYKNSFTYEKIEKIIYKLHDNYIKSDIPDKKELISPIFDVDNPFINKVILLNTGNKTLDLSKIITISLINGHIMLNNS